MRVALIGTHRVGKTSLLEALAEQYPTYEYYQEPYFELQERGYAFSSPPTFDEFIMQADFARKQIENSHPNAFFDRSPLDLLAYAAAVDEGESIPDEFETMRHAMTQIDLIVFVSIEKPDRVPCLVSEMPELREKVHKILSNWILEYSTKTLFVQGSMPERLHQISEAMTLGNIDFAAQNR
ncbi:MAG: hypothetical protein EP332_04285 [Bacteroidetes bacterium]|nr:MAG: hypothetical protein EP332_04285 [Bacteroidota bacterium]